MITMILIFNLVAEAPASPKIITEKVIEYRKESEVDLTGSRVDGQIDLPPFFYVSKNVNPKPESLLERKLSFRLSEHTKVMD